MNDKQELDLNEAAYRRLKEHIRQTYPHGRFVALAGGEIVADAASMEQLHTVLEAMGKDPVKTFIIQAGVDYPEYLIILTQDVRP
ncbi:MAG TPA: hypothetical protein VEL76_12525 [Gemmataceae bacterium]|nr:hypothetical protein [Gemmataceae bacterium]